MGILSPWLFFLWRNYHWIGKHKYLVNGLYYHIAFIRKHMTIYCVLDIFFHNDSFHLIQIVRKIYENFCMSLWTVYSVNVYKQYSPILWLYDDNSKFKIVGFNCIIISQKWLIPNECFECISYIYYTVKTHILWLNCIVATSSCEKFKFIYRCLVPEYFFIIYVLSIEHKMRTVKLMAY